MIKTVPGWLIHKSWSGDTSARIYCFTFELGLVNCLLKGGRTPKKQALLQPFTPLWIHLEERYQSSYAQSVESASPTLPLKGNSLFSALYINELIFYSLKPLSPEPALFNAYLFILNQLSATTDKFVIEGNLRRFEWALLQTCGHGFSLTHEAETETLIQASRTYRLVPCKGFVLAAQGIPGEHLIALAADDLSQLGYLKSAKIIMRQAIEALVGGREIKARALYV